MRKKQRDALAAVQEHIKTIIDQTPWAAAADRIDWCRTCPARAPVVTENGLESPCFSCPLRPLVVALAELQLRQNASLRAAGAGAAQCPKEHTGG